MDDILDIDFVLKCLSEINETGLHSTKHFEIRVKKRKNENDLVPDVKSIYSKILTEKPVSIAKQNDTTFKLLYNLNHDKDLAIIISIANNNPILFNLMTCFIEGNYKRLREE